MRILLEGSGQEQVTVTYINREGIRGITRRAMKGSYQTSGAATMNRHLIMFATSWKSFMVNQPCSTCEGTRLQPVRPGRKHWRL